MRRFLKRSLDIVIVFLVIIALILVSIPVPARAAAEDILIGGAIITWLAGMGIAISGQLGNDAATSNSLASGIQHLFREFATAAEWTVNEVNTFFSEFDDEVNLVLSESGDKFLAFGEDIVGGLTDFGSWLVDNLDLVSNMTSSVTAFSSSSIFLIDGSTVSLYENNTATPINSCTHFYYDTTYTFVSGTTLSVGISGRSVSVYVDGTLARNYTLSYYNSPFYMLSYNSGKITVSCVAVRSNQTSTDDSFTISSSTGDFVNSLYENFVNPTDSELTAKGRDISIPVPQVGENGYVRVPGLTDDPAATRSTVLEGVLSDAVEGDLTNIGENGISLELSDSEPVTEQPEPSPDYSTPGLGSVFPFCIPFDIYNFFSCLLANREAPHLQASIDLKIVQWDIDIDLSSWNTVATILRTMELLAFCVMLAVKTRDLIRG